MPVTSKNEPRTTTNPITNTMNPNPDRPFSDTDSSYDSDLNATSPRIPLEPESRSMWPYIVVALVLIAAVYIGYNHYSQPNTAGTSTSQSTSGSGATAPSASTDSQTAPATPDANTAAPANPAAPATPPATNMATPTPPAGSDTTPAAPAGNTATPTPPAGSTASPTPPASSTAP